MQPILKYLVNIDEEYSKYIRNAQGEIVYVDGEPLLSVSADFNYAENQSRVAEIEELPAYTPNGYETIQKGDRVLLKAVAYAPENKTEVGWLLAHEDIIAIIKGDQLIPVGDRVFLSPIDKKPTSSLIYNPFEKKTIEGKGLVKWCSQSAKEWGVKEGDVAHLDSVVGAMVNFNGETYYTCDKEMLLCDGEYNPYGYYITAEPYPEPETLLFIAEKSRPNTLKGKIIGVGCQVEQLKAGENLLYFRIKYQKAGEYLIMREDIAIGTYTDEPVINNLKLVS